MFNLLRIGRSDRKQFSTRQSVCFRGPAIQAVYGLRIGRDHTLDCGQRATASGDHNFQTAINLFRSRFRLA